MIATNFPSSESTRTTLTSGSRETKFSWKNGDIVAVYSDSKGMTNFYIDDESISEDGVSANFDGSGFKLLENKNYYAFYPYSSSIQSLDKSSIQISYEGQNMRTNGDFSSLGDFDYMYAKGITNESGTAALSFSHLGCVVEYKLIVPQTANYTQVRFELKNEKEEGLFRNGTVDITASTPTIKKDESLKDSIMTVSLNNNDNGIRVSKDSLLTVYMMMPPLNLLGKELIIRLVDNTGKWYSATADGKNMRAGYTYHYEVNDRNGGFTGSGTGLPDGDLSVELISTYKDASSLGYEGMVLDGTTLYASGQFGVSAIDYSNESIPVLSQSLSIKNITNRTDMTARSIAFKDNYMYVPFRQASSGSNENAVPTHRFRFESYIGNYNNINQSGGISSNEIVNSFFKILHLNSVNVNQKIKRVFLYKGFYQNGYYLNTINFQFEDGSSAVLFRETFDTKEKALAALKSEYRSSKGDYCVVDWNALSKDANVFLNFNLNIIGEFDSYIHSETASICSSTNACPNMGMNCIRMSSGNGTSNSTLLVSNMSSTKNDGYISFWCKIDKGLSSTIEIPLLSLSGENVLSFMVYSNGMNNYSIGVKSKNNTLMGTTKLNYDEWYNFKISIAALNVNLWYRTKEASDWNNDAQLTLSDNLQFNQLTTGIATKDQNVNVYFDDYYYNLSNIDNVSYINGKLAIIDKNTFKTLALYNLDTKAIDAKVYGNRLVVTCFYGFNIYDITDAAHPKLTYAYRINNFKESQNCEIYEHAGKVYAFICNYSQGYTIADITDVNNVAVVCVNDYKSITYNGENLYGKIYNFDVHIDYPYAYLTNATMRNYLFTDSDRRGIMTIDLRDLNNPNPRFTFVPSNMITTVTGGDPRPTHIACSGKYLIINNAEKGLLVFDKDADGLPVFTNAITVSGKPCINDIYVPYPGTVFVNDNNHGGSTWPDRNIYLYKGF